MTDAPSVGRYGQAELEFRVSATDLLDAADRAASGLPANWEPLVFVDARAFVGTNPENAANSGESP